MSTAYREGMIAIHVPGKGYGFIKGDDGQKYYFRTGDIQDGIEPAGQLRVGFEAVATARGPAARNISVIADCSEMWVDPERFRMTEQEHLRDAEILHAYSAPCWARAPLRDQARQMLMDFVSSQGANGVVRLRCIALSNGLIHMEGVMVYAQQRAPVASPEELQASVRRVEEALQWARHVDAEHERILMANPLRPIAAWLCRGPAALRRLLGR
jgi:cold shock CspA family protein